MEGTGFRTKGLKLDQKNEVLNTSKCIKICSYEKAFKYFIKKSGLSFIAAYHAVKR